MQTSFARISLAVATLASSLLGCSAKEPTDGVMEGTTVAPPSSTTPPGSTGAMNLSCASQDGAWVYENCQNTTGPCHKADNTRQRTNCQDYTTETCNGQPCMPGTVDTSVPQPNPTTVSPPVTGNPTTPGTGPAAPPGTNPVVVPPTSATSVVPPGSTTTTVPTTSPTPGDTTVVPTSTPTTAPTDTTVPPSGADPAGYWRQDDWQGCSWTGFDDLGLGTSVAPTDFLSGTTDGAYCVSGNVAPSPGYEGVALLGFNLGQDPATADCTYKEVDATVEGPPGVALTGSGIAFNFAKRGADTSFTLRVQIQGPNGAKKGEVGDNDRWCATIEEVQGTAFIPWNTFNTKCWNGEGNDYNGEPISAIVFTVPGNGWDKEMGTAEDMAAATDVPFDFCVNGFAAGESAADAPMGGVEGGDQMGTLGNVSTADRAKVQVDGENYIVQNNAWGSGAGLVLDYTNNSFVVTSATGSGQSAPASFPSIYVGASGFTNNGAYTTRTTDSLPLAIGSIASAQTTFTWSGNNGSFNATYDVWFASSDPAGKRYNDGINGFVMVWLAKPSGGQVPIGSDQGDENIAGHNWDVWAGNRGSGPSSEGADIQSDPNAKVVSFVIQGNNINTLSFDLKDFIDVATSKYGLSSSLLLTDVFGGFEIWNGGTGLKVDEFKINVVSN